jgi:FAD/FMN-containing dehydrogenase
MRREQYLSWGRYPRAYPAAVYQLRWRDEPLPRPAPGMTMLAYGYGRSYGDCCLNGGGILLDTKRLERFIAFDPAAGILLCEAGVSLAQVLELIVPRGFFLPVTPGTRWVSIGGAVANDVHGKNHHRAGSFGCHVRAFELVRSSGERLLCTPEQNAELFRATIGGLGLTGLITWVEFALRPIGTPWMVVESIRYGSLREFFELTQESDADFEYTVAWVDVSAGGSQLGRGIFLRGNHAEPEQAPQHAPRPQLRIPVPVSCPQWVLNRLSARLFNALYWRRPLRRRMVQPYEAFFYPLDVLAEWYRLYGRRGFVQYQCVVPRQCAEEAIAELLGRIRASGRTATLGVLKVFGEQRSPGMLSFPRPGVTLAVDLAMEGDATLRLLEELDSCVSACGGALYPAKDARMSPEMFQRSFPHWREFARFVDPQFCSDFWRRVTGSRGEPCAC